MNKIKEKKLNSIKLQINEIYDFAQSTVEPDLKEKSTDGFIYSKHDKDKTLTLTNIIDSGLKNRNNPYKFEDIKNELIEIKKIMNKQQIILDSILAKLL